MSKSNKQVLNTYDIPEQQKRLRQPKGEWIMSKGIISIDNGGYSTCIVTANTSKIIPSAKGLYHDRKLKSVHGEHDFDVIIDGKRYFAGTLAVESELPLEMHTHSKQQDFFDISTLLAIHQYGYLENFLITPVPIFMHNEEEKNGIIERLKKEWNVTVNGVEKQFIISDVKVAPETVSAFWVVRPHGKVRWVDWGSRTIGYGTTLNDGRSMKFLDKESGTFENKGLEALKTSTPQALVDYVCGKLTAKWKQNDTVFHIGGGALNRSIIQYFTNYFPKSQVHKNPQMALAEGMYALSKGVFKIA